MNPKINTAKASLNKMIGKHVVHHAVTPKAFIRDHWTYDTEDRDVILLAVAGCWAMVCRPGCAPYVEHVKHINF